MSIVHSPPKTATLSLPIMKTPPMVHYSSDSAIHSSSMADQTDSYLNITKRQKRTYSGFANQHCSEDSTEIKAMFTEIRSQQDQKFEALTNALTTIIAQNQDIQKSVDFMSSQYDELVSRVSNLECENLEYKKRIVNLEGRLHSFEKQALCSTIEIRNVPKQSGESKQTITKIVQSIGVSLGLEAPIIDAEFRNIYRSKTAALVVEFTCTGRKEAILSAYRKLNKSSSIKKEPRFNTSHIPNLTNESRPIYISEFLTTKDRRIFYLARESVKNKKFVSAWTSYGKVYVKKEENSPPLHLKEEEDLVGLLI